MQTVNRLSYKVFCANLRAMSPAPGRRRPRPRRKTHKTRFLCARKILVTVRCVFGMMCWQMMARVWLSGWKAVSESSESGCENQLERVFSLSALDALLQDLRLEEAS